MGEKTPTQAIFLLYQISLYIIQVPPSLCLWMTYSSYLDWLGCGSMGCAIPVMADLVTATDCNMALFQYDCLEVWHTKGKYSKTMGVAALNINHIHFLISWKKKIVIVKENPVFSPWSIFHLLTQCNTPNLIKMTNLHNKPTKGLIKQVG